MNLFTFNTNSPRFYRSGCCFFLNTLRRLCVKVFDLLEYLPYSLLLVFPCKNKLLSLFLNALHDYVDILTVLEQYLKHLRLYSPFLFPKKGLGMLTFCIGFNLHLKTLFVVSWGNLFRFLYNFFWVFFYYFNYLWACLLLDKSFPYMFTCFPSCEPRIKHSSWSSVMLTRYFFDFFV